MIGPSVIHVDKPTRLIKRLLRLTRQRHRRCVGMHSVFYIIGVIVVVLAILSLLGLS
jgi:hypothetical protein